MKKIERSEIKMKWFEVENSDEDSPFHTQERRSFVNARGER
jgi:hypothetical protein